MASDSAVKRVPDDERVALYPDLPLDKALQRLLAGDPRKAGTDAAEENPDGTESR